MKKLFVLLLGALVLLALCACSEAETAYTFEKNGDVLEVDQENGTIFDGTYTYQFKFSGDASAHRIDITYPNGAIYHWNQSENMGTGSWSGDYDRWRYVDEDTLCEAIIANTPEPIAVGNILAAIFLIGVGAFYAAAPETAWYWGMGWRFKDAEPSDMALAVNRISGIAAIIIGVVILFT